MTRTEKTTDSRGLRRQQTEDNCGTAARLVRGFKLFPPTEATADAIEQLCQTGGEAQKTDGWCV